MHAFLWILPLLQAAENPPALPWVGDGGVRVLVRIDPPKDGAARAGDERPAEVILDFAKLLKDVAADRIPAPYSM